MTAATDLRLLPVADDRLDPDLEPVRRCHICGAPKNGELVNVFDHWMCESRTDCFQTIKARYR